MRLSPRLRTTIYINIESVLQRVDDAGSYHHENDVGSYRPATASEEFAPAADQADTMLYRALFMVVALLATAQAQEDPCVDHDFAEAHCARPPACTARACASA